MSRKTKAKNVPAQSATPKEVYVGKAVTLGGKPATIEAKGSGACIQQVPKGKSRDLAWPEVQRIMERKKDPQQF